MPTRLRRMGTPAAAERWSGAPAYHPRDRDGWRRHLLHIAMARDGGLPATPIATVAATDDLLTDLLRD